MDVLPVADVLNRVIGAPLANQFHLVLDPTLEQGFIVTSIHDSEDNTTIRVVASGLPELGFGAAYYLRTLVSRCVCVGGLIRYTPLPQFSPHPQAWHTNRHRCAEVCTTFTLGKQS